MKIYINGYRSTMEGLMRALSEQSNIINYCISKKGNVVLNYNDEK